MMAKCKTCGAPVNLAPDGDPRYEAPRPTSRTDIPRHLENMIWVNPSANNDGLSHDACSEPREGYRVYVDLSELAKIYRDQDINGVKK